MKLFDFSKPNRGLWTSSPSDAIPGGALLRNSAIYPYETHSFRSRWGSSLLFNLDAHSLFRFCDQRFSGVTTSLYFNTTQKKTGLNGDRLAFVKMPPSLSVDLTQNLIPDYLFVAGGGELFKVDCLGNTTKWGIEAPANGFTAAVGGAAGLFASHKVIDTFDDSTTFASSGVTISNDGTIKIEGANSMDSAVAAAGIGTATKSHVINLAQFASGAVPSSDQDYIAIWVWVDQPLSLATFQLAFDVGDGTYTNFYTRDVFVGPSSGLNGIGDMSGGQQQNFQNAIQCAPTVGTIASGIVNSLGQTTILPNAKSWTHLLLPKSTFTRIGDSANTWANVSGYKLTINASAVIDMKFDLMELLGGSPLIGTYSYHVTFFNSQTGSRSNPNPTAVTIGPLNRQSVLLFNLPTSADSQVDTVEIWRTVGNGTLFFLDVQLPSGTATYLDSTSDAPLLNTLVQSSLQNILLPFDNNVPYQTLNDCAGPFGARMYWTRDSTDRRKGRVYFSPVGRAEAMAGFVTPTGDDDPMLKVVVWNGALWGFSESKIFLFVDIATDQSPIFKEVYGAPGTTNPFTVMATDKGILYKSKDGIRLFDGLRSELMAFQSLSNLFKGETSNGIAGFNPVVATFSETEYFCSDGTVTLSLDFNNQRWRNVGLGAKALFYESDTKKVMISTGGNVLTLEDEGALTDAGVALNFDVETAAIKTDIHGKGLVQWLFIEANTNSQVVTPSLILDGTVVALPSFVSTSRKRFEWPILKNALIIGLRLDGTLTDQIEIFDAEADIRVGQ